MPRNRHSLYTAAIIHLQEPADAVLTGNNDVKHLMMFCDDYARCTNEYVTIDCEKIAKEVLTTFDELFQVENEDNIYEVESYIIGILTIGWPNALDSGSSHFADELYSIVKDDNLVSYILNSYIKDTQNKTSQQHAKALLQVQDRMADHERMRRDDYEHMLDEWLDEDSD